MAKTNYLHFICLFIGPHQGICSNSVSGSYMDAVFELVAHEVRDLDKSATQFYQDRLTTRHMTILEREGGEPGQMYRVGGRVDVSLVPRPRCKIRKELPGIHCLRMRGSPGFSGELGN